MNARRLAIASCAIAIVLMIALPSMARPGGGFGGGGARGGGGGGGARMGGGGGGRMPSGGGGGMRPMPRPSSAPNFSASRPQVSRPSVNRPSMPASRPQMPQFNRPSGGLNPSTRPSINPSNRPATRPAMPNFGGGNAGGSRPAQRPNVSIPNFGNSRPGGSPRPSFNFPDRPGADGGTRPAPGFGAGGDRPGGNRPGGNLPGQTRPAPRPNPGNLEDFLGMHKPVQPLPGVVPGNRPGAGGGGIRPNPDRPGGGNRPGAGGSGEQWRPGDGNRPGRPGGGVRPGGGGSGEQWRPESGNRPRPARPGYIHDRPNNIYNRPSWANINNTTINNIHNNWTNVINRPGGNWSNLRPDRANYWHNWSGDVRNHWNYHHWHNNWFHDDWYHNHWNNWSGWHYYGYGVQPWSYWWTVPAWTSFNNWFTWGNAWSQPVYYDYGQGGNVVYQDDSVYIGGQQVATADEFAESAAALATVAPPADQAQLEQAEWMPLGTFALSTDKREVEPSRIMQLAVNREGVISGTLVNTLTNQSQMIQGQVDKETQRVAFRIGENEDVIAETGLYNLTQEESPLLVHYGKERTETFLLVRLEAPEGEEGEVTAAP